MFTTHSTPQHLSTLYLAADKCIMNSKEPEGSFWTKCSQNVFNWSAKKSPTKIKENQKPEISKVKTLLHSNFAYGKKW